MDIFDSKGMKGLDIEVIKEEAPEQAILSDKPHLKQSRRLKAALTAAAVLLVFGGAIFGASKFIKPQVYAYALQVDGENVGLFTSYKEAEAVVDDCMAGLDEVSGNNVHYAENISVKQVAARGVACNTAAFVSDSIITALTPIADAGGIYIDGILCIALPTVEAAQYTLDCVKAYYGGGKSDITDIYFAEEVELKPIEINPDSIYDVVEAYDFLINHRYSAPVYTVEQAGESFGDIAAKFSLSAGELTALNPNLAGQALNIGTHVYLAEASKPLTVVVKRKITTQEVVPYDTIKRDNPDEVRGLEKVLQEGADGLNSLVFTVTEKNGVQTAMEQVSCSELLAPSAYIVERGTKTVVASRYFNRSLCYDTRDIEQEFIWPLTGTITDSFGVYRSTGRHTGLDVAVSKGTSVKAMAGGVVVFADTSGSYGKMIRIDHGDGVETWYAHLSKLEVELGDVVEQGDEIALSGNSGRSSGPHLHIEVRIDTVAFNALKFLPEME